MSIHIGLVKTTRILKFKTISEEVPDAPYQDSSSTSSAAEAATDDYERRVCEMLVKKLNICDQTPEKAEEQVENYLRDPNMDRYNQVAREVSDYIGKDTHYISAVKLGAAHYLVSDKTTANTTIELNDAQAKLAILGGFGGGAKSITQLTKTNNANSYIPKKPEGATDGNTSFDKVTKGCGEGVLEYQVKPLHSLIRQENLKKIFQLITAFTIESKGMYQ